MKTGSICVVHGKIEPIKANFLSLITELAYQLPQKFVVQAQKEVMSPSHLHPATSDPTVSVCQLP